MATTKIATEFTHQKIKKEFKHFTTKTSTKHRRQECRKWETKGYKAYRKNGKSQSSPLLLFFSHLVMSNILWPHGLQHTRFPCPSPSPRACSNSCPLSRWCHLTILSCCPLLLLPSIFPSIRVFSNESALHIRWPKYWSFSFTISPSSEYSGLISFRIVWFDLLAVQGALMSLLQHHSSKASILRHSAFFKVQLSHPPWLLKKL